MGIPLGKKAREAVETVKAVSDKASVFIKAALAISALALCLAVVALFRAVKVVNA